MPPKFGKVEFEFCFVFFLMFLLLLGDFKEKKGETTNCIQVLKKWNQKLCSRPQETLLKIYDCECKFYTCTMLASVL